MIVHEKGSADSNGENGTVNDDIEHMASNVDHAEDAFDNDNIETVTGIDDNAEDAVFNFNVENVAGNSGIAENAVDNDNNKENPVDENHTYNDGNEGEVADNGNNEENITNNGGIGENITDNNDNGEGSAYNDNGEMEVADNDDIDGNIVGNDESKESIADNDDSEEKLAINDDNEEDGVDNEDNFVNDGDVSVENIVPVAPPTIRLCDFCHKEICKYRCPRCAFRTCSMLCSKGHKAKYECSGEREKSFDIIKRLADYSPSVAKEDEKFLNAVTTTLNHSISECANHRQIPDVALSASHEKQQSMASKSEVTSEAERVRSNVCRFENYNSVVSDENSVDQQTSSPVKNEGENRAIEQQHWKTITTKGFLLNNAHRRRIWLTLSSDKEGNSSRHEQYSDTIFWTIKIVFRRETEKAERQIIEYSYIVHNIPESIAVATLLRQFIKPKMVGPVVSRSDLDAEKMKPFQEAGLEKLMVYMPVPIENKQRFYVIDPSKTILDNTRSRFILEHPTFIVTLDNQFNDYIMLSEQESQELREQQRQKNRDGVIGRHNNFRGRGGFDNGRFMSHGRRGNLKRSYDSSNCRKGERSRRPWKSGRYPWGGSYQNRSFNIRNADSRGAQESSPFETENIDDSRSFLHPQTTDPMVDAWSQALRINS